MSFNKRFGDLLSEGISSVAMRQQKSMAEIETRAAEAVGYSRSVLQKWRQGKHLPSDSATIEGLVRYCLNYGRIERQWAESLLIQSRHPAPAPLLAELFPASPPSGGRPQLPVFSVDLKPPTGTMPPDSPFYIERPPHDHLAQETIKQQGVTITIKGPRQVGKSSLLMRLADTAEKSGKAVAILDFQIFEQTTLEDVDVFYREFCLWLSRVLGQPIPNEDFWRQRRMNRSLFVTYYMEELLEALDHPLLLALDEVDRLFDTDFRDDFFAMLRGWHNSRARPGQPLWKRLDLALVTSTEFYYFITNLTQSPFNVGLIIELEDFSFDQVIDLNQRHGAPFGSDQVKKLFELVNGHPYLVRQAFYMVASKQVTPDQLFDRTTADRGPFGPHLRNYYDRLAQQSAQWQAFHEIVNSGEGVADKGLSHERMVARLRGAGLVRREDGLVKPRCRLYADYFRERFGD